MTTIENGHTDLDIIGSIVNGMRVVFVGHIAQSRQKKSPCCQYKLPLLLRTLYYLKERRYHISGFLEPYWRVNELFQYKNVIVQ